MPYHLIKPVFDPGELLVSDSILSRGFDFLPLLKRHTSGDWGEICDYYRAENERALIKDGELLSQYSAPDSESVTALLTIVTAADRSYTVLFLPSDPND